MAFNFGGGGGGAFGGGGPNAPTSGLVLQIDEFVAGFPLHLEPLSWELESAGGGHTLKLVVRSYYSSLLLGEKVPPHPLALSRC